MMLKAESCKIGDVIIGRISIDMMNLYACFLTDAACVSIAEQKLRLRCRWNLWSFWQSNAFSLDGRL